MAPNRADADQPEGETISCEDCGGSFRTAQGLGGHRRLKHRLGDADDSEQRESDLDVLEAELSHRLAQLESAGPADRGMVPCPECGSWLETHDNLGRHLRTIHPVENAVASELRTSPERVLSVWREAARKQERHSEESPEQIVSRFWDQTDRAILERLLARNATFRFSEGEE